ELFFLASDDYDGEQVWKTDGSGPGTTLLTSLDEGFDASYPRANRFYGLWAAGSHAFFGTYGGGLGVIGDPLWGMAPGDPVPIRLPGYFPVVLGQYGSRLIYTAGSATFELWASDGTLAGSTLLHTFASGVSVSPNIGIVELAGFAYFILTEN